MLQLHILLNVVTDFIPRWGLPDCIDSDQGTHFTGQVVKEVSRMLKIKWNLHCPYRPQASGQVERSNRTIKTRLSKMHQEGVPWVEALPAVLCSRVEPDTRLKRVSGTDKALLPSTSIIRVIRVNICARIE